MKRLTRREKRQIEHGDLEVGTVLKDKIFKVKTITPMGDNQTLAFESWERGKNLLLTGTAGTGKSFIGAYLGLNTVFKKPDVFDDLTIVRSAVPTRDQGFQKGSAEEKARVYELPYNSIFHDMSDAPSAYDTLKKKGLVKFITTSFIRGITLSNTVILIDEIQNMNAGELHSIITRVGKNTRVILCGDIRQNDLANNRQLSGFADFTKVLKAMGSFTCVEFNRNDIVRSRFVKEYIIAKEKLEDAGEIAITC